ncbi:MAG: thiopeptide-type bacteriocin biosynthesis protein [Flavobacterium sp.]|uniref:thiopeptide-type bacteriocin biosynthesis protein n=1 Tax=Flavobacterium sp. TaxID=239 RepID=UPI001B1F456B|nr:thiopeptide-type bacteriocin biosynthesis protein [Flavobacterium sp.]MBO9586968.1 thiopeptide-type bacteriocin biosynthesis protein [Flavobacterium sp.]
MSKIMQRDYLPGDKWIYYKIYTGHSTSDLILTETILPICQSLLKQHIIDKWFFVRYSDPEHHLRVRLHLKDTSNFAVVVQRFKDIFKKYIIANIIWNIQLDTYKQEIERYGGKKKVELSEDLFFHDSLMISKFVSLIEGEEGEEIRWLFSLRAIDTFLDSFHFTITEKLNLMDQLKTGFGNEFGISRPLKKQLDEKFRINRKRIENFLNPTFFTNPDYIEIQEILDTKRENSIETIKKTISSCKKSKTNINTFVASHIHMTMNRIFKSKGRIHELVIYDFLYRYYLSTYHKKAKVT